MSWNMQKRTSEFVSLQKRTVLLLLYVGRTVNSMDRLRNELVSNQWSFQCIKRNLKKCCNFTTQAEQHKVLDRAAPSSLDTTLLYQKHCSK